MAEDRAVDHGALVGEDAGAVLLGGGQHAAGPGGLFGAGGVGGADGADLAGVDAGGGGEAAGRGVERLLALSALVGDRGVDGVDRGALVGAGGEQHGGAGVADHVAVAAVGVPGGGAAEGGGEVLPAPHQRDHVGVGGQLGRGEDPAGGLAQRHHARPGQGGDQAVHVAAALRLGEHHVAGAGGGQRRHVGREVGAAGRVHPHDGAGGIQPVGGDGLAGGLLVLGGDGVLEVEDHGVGAVGGLGEAVRPVARAEQQRRTQRQRLLPAALLGGRRGRSGRGGGRGRRAGAVGPRAAHAGSRVCISVLRAARTTTSPCWLRPVWTRETTDWPGREPEARTSRISVSL